MPGLYAAWLSNERNDAACRLAGRSGTLENNWQRPKSRPPPAAGPWVRTDGLDFADALPALLAPTLSVRRPPLLDETGAPLGRTLFYSGTTTFGIASRDARCEDWTSAASSGTSVTGGATNASILQVWGLGFCSEPRPLLCFQTGVGIDLPLPPVPSKDAHRMFVSSVPVRGDVGGLAAADAHCASLANKAGYAGTLRGVPVRQHHVRGIARGASRTLDPA